jgi:FixJ family two-component response regulator
MQTHRNASGNISWRGAAGTIDKLGVVTASIAHEPRFGIVHDDTTWQALRSAHSSCSEGSSRSPRMITPIVFLVVEDEYMRRSLQRLISTSGFAVESCRSAEDFMSLSRPAVPCCLLLDISVRGANDFDLRQPVGALLTTPTIVMTDCSDVRVTVQAMKAGAIDVLGKPVNPEELSSAVEAALEVSRAALRHDAAMRELRDRYASLTSRERQVIGLVVSGLLNKQAAFKLGISEITIKAHRGQIMRKMKADSLPDLVRMAARLDVVLSDSTTEFMQPSGPTAVHGVPPTSGSLPRSSPRFNA